MKTAARKILTLSKTFASFLEYIILKMNVVLESALGKISMEILLCFHFTVFMVQVIGQTIGAIGNSLQRLSGIVDADIYFQGHSHQPLHFSNVFFRRDMNHSRMIPVVRHYVSAGSYQGREKFPIVKGMIGKVMGCPVVTLTNKKEVTVSLPTGIKA